MSAYLNENPFIFTPVACHKGRKWKGDLAYLLGYDPEYTSFGSMQVKLWDPAQMKYVYANPNFVENIDSTQEKTESDKKVYIDKVFSDSIAYWKNKAPDNWQTCARASMLKWHRELREFIDEKLPDNRNVFEEVEKTLSWALSLRTRPTVIYGRKCKGGNLYPEINRVRIARRSLHKKGIDKLEEFDKAWDVALTMRGIRKYIDIEYLPKHREYDDSYEEE